MEKEYFLNLIDRYVNDNASKQERLLVEAYYQRMSEKGNAVLDTEAEGALKTFTLEQIGSKLGHLPPIEKEIKIINFQKNSLRWICAAAVLLVVSLGLFFYKSKRVASKLFPDYASMIAPGGNKAVLTLANGVKVVLDSLNIGEIANQSGIKVTKTDDGQLTYVAAGARGQTNQSELLYNTIETPKGGQYKIVLPDATVVWLNAGSSLKYPLQFEGSVRKVELTGEGYFEVTHNKDKPFIVATDKQEITVLGTHFNVNAYSDEMAIKTTLLEGRVKVNSLGESDKQNMVYLKPGEQSVLNSNNLEIKQVNTEAEIDWKNGYFIFKDQDIKTIMRKLSRWYNIDVTYAGSLENMTFSGKISKSKKLKDVLKILTLTDDIKFKVIERRIIVMP